MCRRAVGGPKMPQRTNFCNLGRVTFSACSRRFAWGDLAPQAHTRTSEKNKNRFRGSSFFALTRRTASAAHEDEEQTKELKSRPLEASENRRSTRAKKLPKIPQKWFQNRSKLVPGSLSEATRGAKRRPVAPQRPQEAPGREPEKLEILSPLARAHL